jgi:hypothetical protein
MMPLAYRMVFGGPLAAMRAQHDERFRPCLPMTQFFTSQKSTVQTILGFLQLHPGCSSTSINFEEILARFSNVQSKMV